MTDPTQASGATTPSSRVTLDDVRTVLDGTDPNSTNASKVRALLGGRGSFETIQKHLNTLRQELAVAAALPVAHDQVPALPAEAAQAMWIAAWTAAQVQTMARAEKLAAERDAALLKLETLSQDIAGLVTTVDSQAEQIKQAAQTVATVQAAHLVDIDRLTADLATAQLARSQLTQELDRTRSEAEHAAAMAEAGRELMRQELARLTDQIGELKAALYRRADAA